MDDSRGETPETNKGLFARLPSWRHVLTFAPVYAYWGLVLSVWFGGFLRITDFFVSSVDDYRCGKLGFPESLLLLSDFCFFLIFVWFWRFFLKGDRATAAVLAAHFMAAYVAVSFLMFLSLYLLILVIKFPIDPLSPALIVWFVFAKNEDPCL